MTLPLDLPAPSGRLPVKCEACGHLVPTGVLWPGKVGPVCWRKEHDPPLRLPAIRRHETGDNQPNLFDLIEETNMSYSHFPSDCAEYNDLAVRFGGPRPTIVVLCGSTRFEKEFRRVAFELTLDGAIVVKPDVFMNDGHAEKAHLPKIDAGAKAALDELHKRKIDLADEVLVVSDETGYIGESTRREIEYARKLGKPVRFAVEAAAEVDKALTAGIR